MLNARPVTAQFSDDAKVAEPPSADTIWFCVAHWISSVRLVALHWANTAPMSDTGSAATGMKNVRSTVYVPIAATFDPGARALTPLVPQSSDGSASVPTTDAVPPNDFEMPLSSIFGLVMNSRARIVKPRQRT